MSHNVVSEIKKTSPDKTAGRRWTRWSIRGMLNLTAVMAVLLALYVNHERRPTARAVKELRKSGVHVIYDYQRSLGSPISSVAGWIGEDYFGSVVSVRTNKRRLTQKHFETIASLPTIKRLTLEHIYCDSQHWEILSQLTDLEELSVEGAQFGDDGIAMLSAMRKLRRLNLDDTMVTDQSLPRLAQLNSLKDLYLLRTMVSANAIADFRQARPDCHIQDPGDSPALAILLRMPDGKLIRSDERSCEVKVSCKGEYFSHSHSSLFPSQLWIDSLHGQQGTVQLEVKLGNNYQGKMQIHVVHGIAEPRYVELPMKDLYLGTAP